MTGFYDPDFVMEQRTANVTASRAQNLRFRSARLGAKRRAEFDEHRMQWGALVCVFQPCCKPSAN